MTHQYLADPGTEVSVIINARNRKGTSKTVSVYAVQEGRIVDVTPEVAAALGRKTTKRGFLVVRGSGFNAAEHVLALIRSACKLPPTPAPAPILTAKDVSWRLIQEPDEYSRIDGSFSHPRDVAWIKKELRDGNSWAWCYVKLVGSFHGLEEEDSLGGCSYESEAAFKAEGGYYTDMQSNILDSLNKQLAFMLTAVAKL